MARSRSNRDAKRVQPAKKIERRGIALIGKVVAYMGHLWNEPQNDFGTDGSIELVNPVTGKATNRIVLVQSKATSVPFGDRPLGFTCDEDDLRYWLHGNAPVILIRSHPASDEAYWVSIKDYFRDHPERRASRRILFDREHHRFDASSDKALWDLARPRVDGLHLGTPPVHETLVSNLLAVESIPETIYTAKATISRGREARAVWGETPGDWPRDWIVLSGQIYSFADPSTGPLSKLCTGPVESFASSAWADSEDEELHHRFVWLLKGALSGQIRPALRSSKDLTWVVATEDLPVVIPIPATSTTRTVVKEYLRDDGTVRYVRHLAFLPTFVRYDGQWFLELTPTYHFTRDGNEPDFFAGSYRSKIKRIERHSDFRRNVNTLARLLRSEVDLGGLTPDPGHQLLGFGELADVRLDTGDDDVLDELGGVEAEADEEGKEERGDDRTAAEEPEMQFGRGAHVNPRFGLLDFGPADQTAEAAPSTIAIGVVGTQETIEGVLRWLRRCRKQINPPADKRTSNFFPPFPGFTSEVGLESELMFDSRLQRSVPNREIRKLAQLATRNARLDAAVELLLEEITEIGEHGLARAILVCPPLDLLQLIKADAINSDADHAAERSSLGPSQLHDVLKAAAMRVGVPLQFVLPATYDASLAAEQTTATGRPRTQQDEATKAWNLHTALYYKAGGFPWSLVRDPHALDSCFIGISFYFDNAGNLATSSAQVFDERGEGIIVRGGQAKLTKGDKRPYLDAADAEKLLVNALKRYRSEHRNLPARVVIHKSSRFRAEEIEGLQRAADAERITELELVAIGPSRTRVSARKHAPLRGTHIVLDDRHQVLYTSGSVPFYEFYPGPYVPQPISITLQQSEQSTEQHASEILALTKLNWNNSRLDGRDPITMRAARSIGTILRHVDDNGTVGARYAFYM